MAKARRTHVRTQSISTWPIASSDIRPNRASFHEVELRPIEDVHQRTSLLVDGSTHTDGHIEPARDGILARIGDGVLRYGAAATFGSVIGVGIAIKKSVFLGDEAQVDKYREAMNSINSDGIRNPM